VAQVVAPAGPGAPVNSAGIPQAGVQKARLGGKRATAAIDFANHGAIDEPAARKKKHAELIRPVGEAMYGCSGSLLVRLGSTEQGGRESANLILSHP